MKDRFLLADDAGFHSVKHALPGGTWSIKKMRMRRLPTMAPIVAERQIVTEPSLHVQSAMPTSGDHIPPAMAAYQQLLLMTVLSARRLFLPKLIYFDMRKKLNINLMDVNVERCSLGLMFSTDICNPSATRNPSILVSIASFTEVPMDSGAWIT
jgi:hypothetical protein